MKVISTITEKNSEFKIPEYDDIKNNIPPVLVEDVEGAVTYLLEVRSSYSLLHLFAVLRLCSIYAHFLVFI